MKLIKKENKKKETRSLPMNKKSRSAFAMLGFITYHGMTAEQFIWAWLRSEMLEPKEFKFEDSNYYYAALKDTIEELQTGRPGKKRRKEPKHFSKRKEAKHD